MDLDIQSLQDLRCSATDRSRGDAHYDKVLTETANSLDRIDPKTLLRVDLDALDPTLDTLPYLFVLALKISHASANGKPWPEDLRPGGRLWKTLVVFLCQCDPVAVRYSGSQWLLLVETLRRTAHQPAVSEDPVLVLEHVASAILRVDPTAGTFTSTHCAFIQSCLELRSCRAALMVLEKDIHSFPSQSASNAEGLFPCSKHHLSNGFITQASGLTDSISLPMVQRYYVCGAMIFITLKKWRQANHFLDYVLSTPTQSSANGLMVEAYKKRTLTHLLAHDSAGEPLKLANSNTTKVVRNVCKSYDCVASAFKDITPLRLHAEYMEGSNIWRNDGNEGLMKNVIEHHKQLFVSRFGTMYTAMPLKLMASKLFISEKEAERYMNSLIEQGVLKANVEHAKNRTVLRFTADADSGSTFSSEEQLRDEILLRTKRMKALAQHIDETDRQLGLTKEYVEHVRKSRKAKDERPNVDEEAMDMSYAHPTSDDEDGAADTMKDIQ